jgi:lambda repressor-like predicted transcriptional regulator
MGAKQSAEMKKALALVEQGIPIREAARQAGVWYTSLHAALKKIKESDKTSLT